MNKTGRAPGTVDPVIYFENAKGHVMLPPIEIGKGLALARRIFEERAKPQGYEWREAGTLAAARELQAKLIHQEVIKNDDVRKDMGQLRREARQRTAANLRQRMISADCKPFERDFIKEWLLLSEEKQKKYEQVWDQGTHYLWSLEMDSGTKVEDRIK